MLKLREARNLLLSLALVLSTIVGQTTICHAAEQAIKAVNDGIGVTEHVATTVDGEEETQRSFNYEGEGVPNSDPILYVGTYDMYTDYGTASFTLSTALEDKIRVVGPFSPSTLNHYYLCERQSYNEACRQKLMPNHWAFMDISVQSLPVDPEIAKKATYIKEFSGGYIAAIPMDNLNPVFARNNSVVVAKVQEILDSIKIVEE